jgi:hypothetical protein
MHTWIAIKGLTYVQPVLMPVYKIPTLNFERGPKCFWDHRTAPFEPLHLTMIYFFRQYQDLPLVLQSILFLHTNANSCICVDNIKIEKRTFGQHNYCSWHTVSIKVHNIAPNSITHYTSKCKELLMSQFSLQLSICKFSFPSPFQFLILWTPAYLLDKCFRSCNKQLGKPIWQASDCKTFA